MSKFTVMALVNMEAFWNVVFATQGFNIQPLFVGHLLGKL